MYQVVNDEIRKSLLIVLRPLVQINFILGTCPCVISPEGRIRTPYKYFNVARFFLTVGCFLFFSISSLANAFLNICTTDYTSSVSATKDGKWGSGQTLAAFVDMACGFYVNLIPAIFLCIASFKRKAILAFFDTMSKYVDAIRGFGDYGHFKRIITRLYVLHGSLALTMALVVILRFASQPEHLPGSITIWFVEREKVDHRVLLWVTAPFVVFLSFAKTGVVALIEVSCVSLACCFCKVSENIQDYLSDMMSHWNTRFLELPLTTSILQRGSNSEKGRLDEGKSKKVQMDIENYLEQIRRYNHSDYPSAATFSDVHGRVRGDFCDYRELTPGQQIIHVIFKFQAIRNVQTATNGLFGSVLAINMGLVVFISVVVKYMLIWNFGNLLRHYHGKSSNFSDGEIPVDNNQHMFMHTNSPTEWIMFALFDFCFAVRLFVLVVCLGNVYSTSLNFNSKLTSAILQAQKIGDIVEMQGMGNKYFQGRPVITQNEANTALAFITENSANPMAFSAAGLFCFSRSLILVIISIIITYLVFLLQV